MLDDVIFEQAQTAVDRIYEDAAIIAFGVSDSFAGTHRDRPWPAWFSETIDRLPNIPSAVFDSVWREALTPSWFSTLANRASAANRGGAAEAAALDRHLSHFILFSEGFRRAGADLPTAPETVSFDRDVVIPGTAVGIKAGRAVGAGISGDYYYDVDVAVWKQARLRLAPEALDLPWEPFEPVANARAFADGKGPDATESVTAMLRAMERYSPEIYDRFSSDISIIGLLDSRSADVFNASNSNYFGGFIVAAIDNPYELAAYALHEHAHNLLFAIETVEPTLEGDQGEYEGPLLYSPWREDLRPIRGILHAVFVHLPVCSFWLSVAQDPDTDEIRRYALDQLARFLIQIDVGLDAIQRDANLTSNGENLMISIKSEAGRLRDAAVDFGVYPDRSSLICRPGGIDIERHDGNTITLRQSLASPAKQANAPSRVFDILNSWPDRTAVA